MVVLGDLKDLRDEEIERLLEKYGVPERKAIVKSFLNMSVERVGCRIEFFKKESVKLSIHWLRLRKEEY